MPMNVILFQPTQYMSPDNWLRKLGAYADFDPTFRWPESIAVATNSVASEQFNPHPPGPRIYSALDYDIVQKKQSFCDATSIYYEVKLKSEAGKPLKDILSRRIGYSGEDISLTGVIF